MKKMISAGVVATTGLLAFADPIVSYEEEILGVQLPAKVALEVTECEPGIKGDTVSGTAMKDAVLETGLKIRVPLFINQGDKVSIDTVTGKYDGRA